MLPPQSQCSSTQPACLAAEKCQKWSSVEIPTRTVLSHFNMSLAAASVLLIAFKPLFSCFCLMNPASGMILKSTTDSCVQNWKKETGLKHIFKRFKIENFSDFSLRGVPLKYMHSLFLVPWLRMSETSFWILTIPTCYKWEIFIFSEKSQSILN